MMKRLRAYLDIGLLAIVILAWLFPFHRKSLLVVQVVSAVVLWIWLAWRCRRWKTARWVAAILPLLAITPFLLPARPLDTAAVRMGYVERLRAMEGTYYVWGGEGAWGVDCSGLPRRTLRRTLFWEGLCTLNGSGPCAWLEHWWHDASAKALMEGYRGYMVPLGITGTIKTVSTESLLPGDVAITHDGVHVICYLGDDEWIQADPSPMGVVITHARTGSNGWFGTQIAMFRWSVLTPGSAAHGAARVSPPNERR